MIRGLSPYPAAWCELHNGEDTLMVKIYNARSIIEHHTDEPGSIKTSKREIKVAVQDGYVLLVELQLPGKKKMDAAALLNGFSFEGNAKMA
jgi:methionyl-tRNA formyltransferase